MSRTALIPDRHISTRSGRGHRSARRLPLQARDTATRTAIECFSCSGWRRCRSARAGAGHGSSVRTGTPSGWTGRARWMVRLEDSAWEEGGSRTDPGRARSCRLRRWRRRAGHGDRRVRGRGRGASILAVSRLCGWRRRDSGCLETDGRVGDSNLTRNEMEAFVNATLPSSLTRLYVDASKARVIP